MKSALALLAALALGTPALAQKQVKTPLQTQRRASTTNMTCAQATAVVTQQGAVVLGTGGQTYDRFVRYESLCPTGLYARPAFEPTRDNPNCLIGYYCTNAPPFEDPF